jgi:hypothetical protein
MNVEETYSSCRGPTHGGGGVGEIFGAKLGFWIYESFGRYLRIYAHAYNSGKVLVARSQANQEKGRWWLVGADNAKETSRQGTTGCQYWPRPQYFLYTYLRDESPSTSLDTNPSRCAPDWSRTSTTPVTLIKGNKELSISGKWIGCRGGRRVER